MTPPKVPADRTTVLVVDDEDGIRQALTRFLSRLGYHVEAASNAVEALQQLSAHRPQAMLCDIRMPETSGVELLAKVLAEDPDLAVLMLTAIDEPRTAIECLKLGAYDYLIKPVDLEELELSLQHALRQRQLEVDRRELEQWLAREVAVRTRDLEERSAVIEEVALDALAAARDWEGTDAALSKLAEELGAPREELVAELKRRRG
ncbi:MAG TPA: response regulator [Gemmatimonadales bacterium]|jgi:putative two-component system response regulator|nr:response regulator [Gemmatimonadales bacterium]